MRSTFFWDVTQRGLVVTDVSGKHIGPVFKGQAVRKEWVTLENGSDMLSRNVYNHRSTLHNIPQDRRSNNWIMVESSWNTMAHGDAQEGKWRGNWRMEWVASTLHTTSEHVLSSVTTADLHTSAASSRLNWRPRQFKLTRPFRRKTKSGFCACAITFQTQSTWIQRITIPCRNEQLYRLKGYTKYILICILMLLCDTSLTFSRLMTYIYIYIYIYVSYPTANLQMLHFIYLFNKYTYWIF